MPLSRRNFLEVSALSASALMLQNLAKPKELVAEPSQAGHDANANPHHPGTRARLDLGFDHDWHFYRPAENELPAKAQASAAAVPIFPRDAEWEAVTLPHTVRLEPRDVSGGRNYQGVCWYRKSFRLKPEWKDRVVYLRFQGAMQVADVWLNGQHLRTH